MSDPLDQTHLLVNCIHDAILQQLSCFQHLLPT
jgi:hypothetical protein